VINGRSFTPLRYVQDDTMHDEKEGIRGGGKASASNPLHRTMETPVIPTIGRDLFVISVCLIINNWALEMTGIFDL